MHQSLACLASRLGWTIDLGTVWMGTGLELCFTAGCSLSATWRCVPLRLVDAIEAPVRLEHAVGDGAGWTGTSRERIASFCDNAAPNGVVASSLTVRPSFCTSALPQHEILQLLRASTLVATVLAFKDVKRMITEKRKSCWRFWIHFESTSAGRQSAGSLLRISSLVADVSFFFFLLCRVRR